MGKGFVIGYEKERDDQFGLKESADGLATMANV